MVRWVNLKKLLGHAESQLQDSDSNGPFFRCCFCCREGTWLQMTPKSWLTVPVVTSMQSSNFFLGGSFNEMISLLKETKSSQGVAKLKKTNSNHHHYFQIAIAWAFPVADSVGFIHTLPFPTRGACHANPKCHGKSRKLSNRKGGGGSLLVDKKPIPWLVLLEGLVFESWMCRLVLLLLLLLFCELIWDVFLVWLMVPLLKEHLFEGLGAFFSSETWCATGKG